MAVELATAYISLVPSAKGISDKLREELGAPLEKAAREQGRKAGDQLEAGFSGGLKKAAAGLAAAFAGVQIGSFVKGAIDAAADIGEQMSKLGVLVGDNAKEIGDWGDTTAEAFGISKREALTATGVFANFFRGAGVGQDEAAKMSKAMVELAADMASFNNVSPADTLEALRAGLAGETEPLRAFGVMLDDATLRLKALDLGLVENTKSTLPPAIKLQAAYAAILEQTTLQQGDFARTSDSLSNQQRILKARFDDTVAALGAGLLPIAEKVVGAISGGLLPAFEKSVPVVVEMVETVFELGAGLVNLVSPLAEAAGLLGGFGVGAVATGVALSELAEGFEIAKANIVGLIASAGTLTGGLGILAAVVGGAALLGFTSYASTAAEAEERQQQLTKALSEAGDPAQGLVERLSELTGTLSEVKEETTGATEGVKAIDAVFAQSVAAGDKTEKVFNRIGISAKEMADVTRAGSETFRDASQQALNLAQGTADLELATRSATEEQRAFIESLFALQRSGELTDNELASILQTLDNVADAWDDTREAQTASIQADIDKAVSLEAVTASWVEDQRAASGAKDEYGQLLFIGQQLAGVLDTQAGAAGTSAVATAGMGTEAASAALSASELAASQEEAARAAEEHEKALDALAGSVSEYIGLAQAAEAMDDLWASTVTTLALNIRDQTEAGEEGRASVEGQTVAARENRDVLRELVQVAGEDIAAKVKQGATTAEVTALAESYAVRLNEAAVQTGLGETATDRYEQQIREAAAAVAQTSANLAALDNMAVNVPVTLTLQQVGVSEELLASARAQVSAALAGERAGGGPVQAGKAYVVGEEGPEVYVPDVNGTIIPNHELTTTSIGDMWAGEDGTLYAEVVVKLDGREIQRNQARIERAGR